MASQLSDHVIDQPARKAIEVLLELREDLSRITQDSLSEDAKILLRWYLKLQSQLQPPPKRTELEEYARELSSMFASMFVENYSQYILQDLTYATRLKLAIIFWHFDDPDWSADSSGARSIRRHGKVFMPIT